MRNRYDNWEKLWQEKERALRQRIETIQVLTERNKINRDLDLLFKEIEHRKRNLGETYEEAQANLANFQDLCSNVAVRTSEHQNFFIIKVRLIIFLNNRSVRKIFPN